MQLDSYLAAFKSKWAALVAVATAGPVALFASDLAPPWPSETGGAAAALGVLATLIGLLLAFLDGAQNRSWRRKAGLSLGVALLLALFYIACWSITVVEVPQQIGDQTLLRRFVIGFSEHPEGISAADAIRTYGPEDAFSARSVLVGRLALLGSWAGMFLLLTYGFGLVLLADARRSAKTG